MNLDMGPIVESFAGSDVTIRRRTFAGFDASGYDADATMADTAATVVMQRPSPDALQRVPEGERAAMRWLIHVPDSVDVRGAGQAGGGVLADEVIHNGTTYTVVEIEDQTEHGQFRRFLLRSGGA